MNYVVGFSSETISALQGLGNFGWEKLVDFFPVVCKQIELSAKKVSKENPEGVGK